MKLCTAMMFDGNVERFTAKIQDLEAAGVDMVLIPEIYGFDQISVLGFIAAKTERIELMTAIVNVYSRSPALIAQSAATIDALSGGRFTLGIGTSGAQVIEGWHGVPFKRPLGRTRDTVDICRKVWSGDKVTHDGKAVSLEAQGRHDPCVLPRAVPIVEAMVCLVLADHWLRQRAVDVL